MMKKQIMAAVCVAVLAGGLSGCAGLSQQDRAERALLFEKQQAAAQLQRKQVKLSLTKAAVAAAQVNVVKTSKEVRDASAKLAAANLRLQEAIMVESDQANALVIPYKYQ